MRIDRRFSVAALGVWALLAPASVADAQSRGRVADAGPGREHFQLKLGAGYDVGDFGTSDTTHSAYAPVTLRYLGEKFELGVTASLIYLDTQSSVVIVDGLPVPSEQRRRTEEAGVGDLIFRARYYAVDDAGVDSAIPALTPFAKLKAPTADESKGLGTGEWDGGFGLEVDKRFREFFVLGDVSYTFMGDPPDQDFRDRPGASLGIGRDFTPSLAVIALLDWRRALVRGGTDPLELVGIAQIKLARTLTLSPYTFIGLTDGSPDFGIGAEVSWRFGRY
jgi:hypothetical protein